jgi:SAM-dependent methyltransferase
MLETTVCAARIHFMSHRIKYWIGIASANIKERARIDFEGYLQLMEDLRPYVKLDITKKVMDIGCGRFYPLTLMLHSQGIDIIGIDIATIEPNAGIIKRLLHVWRNDGLTGFLKEFYLWATNKQTIYFRTLESLCGFQLTKEGMRIQRADAENLEQFETASFDLVLSVAVFEHVRNPTKILKEIRRILKPNGFAYIEIHQWTAPSGPHDPYWKRRNDPWEHLRNKSFRAPVFVNKIRKKEWIEYFNQAGLTIVQVLHRHPEANPKCIPPELLKDFTEEELIYRGLTIIARVAPLST